jgi:hypothetical protein
MGLEASPHPFVCPSCRCDLVENSLLCKETGVTVHDVSLSISQEEGIGGREILKGVDLDYGEADFFGDGKETFECRCGVDITQFLNRMIKKLRDG